MLAQQDGGQTIPLEVMVSRQHSPLAETQRGPTQSSMAIISPIPAAPAPASPSPARRGVPAAPILTPAKKLPAAPPAARRAKPPVRQSQLSY